MSKDTKYSLLLAKELKKRGLRASDLKPAELASIAARAMGPAKAVRGGFDAAVSVARTKVLGIRVPLEVIEARREGCRSNVCGFYSEGRNGSIICRKCGCFGRLMQAAIEDPNQSCRLPPGEKVWDKYVDPNQS